MNDTTQTYGLLKNPKGTRQRWKGICECQNHAGKELCYLGWLKCVIRINALEFTIT